MLSVLITDQQNIIHTETAWFHHFECVLKDKKIQNKMFPSALYHHLAVVKLVRVESFS